MSKKLQIQNPEDIDVVWQDFRCMYCNKFLSVAPIYYEKSVGNICGRCVKDKDIMLLISSGLLQRATTYEMMAKTIQFPCCNTRTCEAMLNWEEVLLHENICNNNMIKCPFTLCTKNFDVAVIRQHIINDHSDYYKMYNGKLILQLYDMKQLYFTEAFDQIFLIEVLFNNSVLNCLVKCIPKTTVYDYKLYTYTVELLSENGKHEYNGDVQGLISTKSLQYVIQNRHGYSSSKYCISFIKKSNAEVVTIDTHLNKYSIKNLIHKYLKNNLSEPSNSSQLKVRNADTLQDLEAKILEELECPICTNYMKKVIYVCTTGHSICDDCSLNMEKCPICRSDFIGGRNFQLERLSELLKFPCTFSQFGCQETFNNSNMKLHVMNCLYRSLNCPIEVCEDYICLLNVCHHLREMHPTLVFQESELFEKLVGVTNAACHYTIVDGQLFVFKFQCEDKLSLKFDCVQVCLTDASENYKFKLQFFGSDHGLEFNLERLCKKDLAQLGYDPKIIPMSLIQDFVVQKPNTSLQFKCIISKI